MGLTAEDELSLRDAGLVSFFDQRRAAFKAIVTRSYEYAYGYVSETGLPLRQDDVGKSLVAALVTNQQLRVYLAGRGLRQKFWYQRLADLIIARLWRELSDEYAARAGQAGQAGQGP